MRIGSTADTLQRNHIRVAFNEVTNMLFRKARPDEIEGLFAEGYKVWSRSRTFEQYCSDNRKEDAKGIRYVLEKDGEIVSSLMLLKLNDFQNREVYGIGSVLTPERHSKKGYASILLKKSIETVNQDAMIFLHSDIKPAFYSRFGFRALPPQHQKKEGSVCMLRCTEDVWEELLAASGIHVPTYF